MSSKKVTLNNDENSKDEPEEPFFDLGITLNDAVDALLNDAVEDGSVPPDDRSGDTQIANDEKLDALSKKIIEQNAEAYEELAK